MKKSEQRLRNLWYIIEWVNKYTMGVQEKRYNNHGVHKEER